MELFRLLEDYPKTGAALISLVGIFFGVVINNIVHLYQEKLKYKRELRSHVLKEKINAAKKATEFYLEQLNFYNLLIHQFEIFSSKDIADPQMIDDLNNEVQFYSEKLKKFPHFEYHHINLFYDLINEKSNDLVSESFQLNKEILDLRVRKEDSSEVIFKKISRLTEISKRQKEIYQEHYRILLGHLRDIRSDLSEIK